MLFDTHAHLDDDRFNEDRESVIERIKREGVSLVMNPGADMASSQRAIQLSLAHDFIYAAVGVHPHDVKDMVPEDMDKLRIMAASPKVKAIGEIGLDYYYDNSPRPLQKEMFAKQLQLANELGLPAIIHSRDAVQDTFDIIKENLPQRGCVLHSFNQSLEMAKAYMNLGCFLSFSGPITFKNARNAREILLEIPMDKIFIETDSPYLTPEPYRGKRNDPSKVRQVALEIARIKGLSLQEVADVTMKNGMDFFGIVKENI